MDSLKQYVDWKLAHSDKVLDVEGYPLVMENCKTNKRMKQLEVYGDCFQRLGSKNLLPYPYSKTTATINGVTFTDNGDGSITINGTATANAVFYLYMNNTTLIPGIKRGDMVTGTLYSDQEWSESVEKLYVVLNYYDANTTMKNGNAILNSSRRVKTLTITDDWYGMGFYILVLKGGVVNNITLRVQIELGTTSTEYEPYVLSPSPDCPSEIETVGDLTTKNLFNANSEQYNLRVGTTGIVSANNYKTIFINVENITNFVVSFLNSTGNVYCALCDTIEADAATYNAKTVSVAASQYKITDNTHKYLGISIYYTNVSIFQNIQVEEGTVATEYEPYHKYKIPIVVRGKNLLVYPYIYTTKTIDGITFTDNGDGSIILNGITTLSGTMINDFILAKIKLEPGTYTISGCPIGGGTYTYRIFLNINDSNNTTKYVSDIGKGATFSIDSISTVVINIRFGGQLGTVSNLVFKPQLEKNTVITEYEPYVEPITQNIYLDEPLRKIEDYADYIDFKNKRVIRNVKEITFENKTFTEYSYGTTLDNTYHFNIRNMGCIYRTPMFCNIMKAGSINMNSDANDTFFTSMYSNVANGGIYLQIEKALIDDYSGESNVEKLKLFLLEKQAKLLYCVSEYTEEDISCQLPKTVAKTTIIEADTSLSPSNFKGKYIKK